jgi:GTP-binding protein
MITEFLSFCPNLKLVIQLVDIRHKPSIEDEEFQTKVQTLGIPCLVVANKVDKLKKNQITRSIKEIKQALHLSLAPIAHSAPQKVGQFEIWQQLKPILE